MASPLSSILDLFARKISERGGKSSGSNSILDQLSNYLGQRGKASNGSRSNPRPASEDPYGDPADEKGAKRVKPASEDPYGDPADRK
jgi:hypothetical protein